MLWVDLGPRMLGDTFCHNLFDYIYVDHLKVKQIFFIYLQSLILWSPLLIIVLFIIKSRYRLIFSM